MSKIINEVNFLTYLETARQEASKGDKHFMRAIKESKIRSSVGKMHPELGPLILSVFPDNYMAEGITQKNNDGKNDGKKSRKERKRSRKAKKAKKR